MNRVYVVYLEKHLFIRLGHPGRLSPFHRGTYILFHCEISTKSASRQQSDGSAHRQGCSKEHREIEGGVQPIHSAEWVSCVPRGLRLCNGYRCGGQSRLTLLQWSFVKAHGVRTGQCRICASLESSSDTNSALL
jgi:hypothetical protein